MSMIETGRIKVPFIRTYGNEEPYPPTKLDPDGPIRDKINAKLKNPTAQILRAGNHADVQLDSVRPHHKEGSTVHWLPQVQNNTMVPWNNPQSWEQLISDTEFLDTFQAEIESEVAKGNPYYAQFGWTPFNENPEIWFAKQGGMTIKRAHGHSTPPFDRNAIDGYITIEDVVTETDFRFLSLFFDIGAQLAREHISQIKDFSSHTHSWTSLDGLVKRTAYGFDTLQDALSQLYSFHRGLKDEWNHWAEKLYKEYAGDFTVKVHGVEKSLVLFSPIVGGSLFIPTEDERKAIGLDPLQSQKIWVSLLSPIMKPLLVNGVQVLRG